MSVEIIERVITSTLDIEVSIDNYATSFFDTIDEFSESFGIEVKVLEDTTMKDIFIISVKNKNKSKFDYSVAIDKRGVSELIDKFITTLEKKEEYELCQAFLKLKNKYKNLKYEK